MKFKTLIISILILGAFGLGFSFRDQILDIYYNIGKSVQDFQKTDMGSMMTQVGKEILTPPPLSIGGAENKVVLLKSKIIEETNLQRKENGLPELVENEELSKAAEAKANDMFLNQYFEHVSPTGVDPGHLVQAYGYDYIVTGENLILGNFKSEKELVKDWMDSPGHRANILNNRYAEIGVSVIKGTYKGETVWIGVQEFGLPLSTCASPSATLRDKIDFNKNQLDLLSGNIEQKKSEIDDTNQMSAHYKQLIDDYNRMVENYNSLAEETKQLIAQYNQQVNDFNACVNGN
jgi:uncharacterized protein YkwD